MMKEPPVSRPAAKAARAAPRARPAPRREEAARRRFAGAQDIAWRKTAEATSSPVQRKLCVGCSNDPLERDADRAANRALAERSPRELGSVPVAVQRSTQAPTAGAMAAPPSVARVLAQSGRQLDPAVRRDMEARFGHDFSKVRVHDDAEAGQSARDVGASAYTVGSNIAFATGRYAPESGAGRRLLAHELAHVIQQTGETRLRRQPSHGGLPGEGLRAATTYGPGSTPNLGRGSGKPILAIDIVHDALNVAGFFPVLGAIPDGLNAIIYAIEGDWENVGLSAIAMIPYFGDGIKLATMGTKTVLKVSDKAVLTLGKEGIAKAFKETKATSKLVAPAKKGASKTLVGSKTGSAANAGHEWPTLTVAAEVVDLGAKLWAYSRPVPVMPKGLSASEEKHWKLCRQLHLSYERFPAEEKWFEDTIRTLRIKHANKKTTPQDLIILCRILEDHIKILELFYIEKWKYVNNKCDKFDWFNKGTTEAERLRNHKIALDDLSREIKKLEKLFKNAGC